MQGILIYNGTRPDIAFDNGRLLGGLHCGDCFLCQLEGNWLNVRLELQKDWLLVSNNQTYPVPYGARVEI